MNKTARQLRFTMPNISEHQLLLNSLARAQKELGLYLYVSMLQEALSNADANSDDDSPPSSIHLSDSSSSPTDDSDNSHSESSESSDHNSDSESTTQAGQSSSESGSSESMDLTQMLMVDYYGMLVALEDEVAKVCVLHQHPPSTRIPQLQLLDEWQLDHPELYQRKLRVFPEVFTEIVKLIKDHPIFHNNSTKPQLPVQIQLAIFLNAAGHYGNAATSQDMAEWAGVSKGTVYNCYKWVMLAILHHHDSMIHFDPTQQKYQEEKQRAQRYVEERTCSQWKGGFLCVDGTSFPLFQKPGWYGKGYFDRKCNYSLINQVSTFLKICLLANDVYRSYAFLTIYGLLTTSLEYLEVFMTQLPFDNPKLLSHQNNSLVKMSGFGLTVHIQ
jgi:hypothetical protein